MHLKYQSRYCWNWIKHLVKYPKLFYIVKKDEDLYISSSFITRCISQKYFKFVINFPFSLMLYLRMLWDEVRVFTLNRVVYQSRGCLKEICVVTFFTDCNSMVVVRQLLLFFSKFKVFHFISLCLLDYSHVSQPLSNFTCFNIKAPLSLYELIFEMMN